MKKLLLPLVAVAALVVGAAPATSESTATKTVQIKRSAFQPATVTIKTGDAVKWVNTDTQNHQVVSNNGSFVSPILGPGKSYSHTFNAAGTYRYHDGLNAAVKGVVKVTGPPPAVTIGLNKPIVTYGESVVLAGAVSSGNANDRVTLYEQPYPQGSFAQLTQVLTSTGGAWRFSLRPCCRSSSSCWTASPTARTTRSAAGPRTRPRRRRTWTRSPPAARAGCSTPSGRGARLRARSRTGRCSAIGQTSSRA